MSRVLRLLPDHVRTADDGTLANFLGGAEDALALPLRLLADATRDADGLVRIIDPEYAPASALPWVAALLGADISGLSDADARWYLARRGRSAVGSRQGIRDAVGATLTGTRFVSLTRPSLWEMTVTVKLDEVVDVSLTLDVAQRNAPAGVVLTVVSDTPVTLADLAATYTDLADIAATGKTLDELRFG